MTYCDTPGCAGHLGKFPDCLTEALWDLSINGFDDDTTGDSEFRGHFTLLVFPEEYPRQLENGPLVMIPAGAYLVTTYESGAVVSERFDSEADARTAFDAEDQAYSAWLDGEGVVSSDLPDGWKLTFG